MEVVTDLRRYRDDVDAKSKAAIPARLAADGYDALAGHIARLAGFEFVADGDGAQPLAELPIPGGSVQVLASDAFDPDEAAGRLAARRSELEAEIARAEGKLANEGFVAKAPPEVVEAEREKLENYRRALERLT
jgi:valyl-tRNA synthetase